MIELHISLSQVMNVHKQDGGTYPFEELELETDLSLSI
jgi:hypothetical protein